MKRTIAVLKGFFTTGKRPSASDFGDIFDSFVHLDSQAAVDGQVVDTKLQAYDQALKVRNINGKVDTLGDLLAITEGMGDGTGSLKTALDNIDWTKVPNKPPTVPLQWSDQVIVTDTSKFDPQPRDPALPQTTNTNPAQKWLLTEIGALVSQNLIIDIKIERRWLSNNGTPFYVDQIVMLKIAVNPKAKLN